MYVNMLIPNTYLTKYHLWIIWYFEILAEILLSSFLCLKDWILFKNKINEEKRKK